MKCYMKKELICRRFNCNPKECTLSGCHSPYTGELQPVIGLADCPVDGQTCSGMMIREFMELPDDLFKTAAAKEGK